MRSNNRRRFLLLAGLAVAVTLATSDQVIAQAPTSKKFAGEKPGHEWGGNGLKMKFCWCPPGKFVMGSPKNEKERGDDEEQVSVALTRGYWLGKHEVTQAQWKTVMGTQPWAGRFLVKEGNEYPATHLSWEDAVKFCAALTKRDRSSGKLPVDWEYRLPTDAQWEYACRAGSKTRYGMGDDDSRLGDYAWYNKNARDVGERYAHRVGTKRSSVWGLHDMRGNVFEWCRDWYRKELPGGADPEVTTKAAGRVYRGGSWFDPSGGCRCAFRHGARPAARGPFIGFRLAAVQVSK